MIQLFIFIFLLATFLYYIKDKIKDTFNKELFSNQFQSLFQLTSPILITDTTTIQTSPSILTDAENDLSSQVILYLNNMNNTLNLTLFRGGGGVSYNIHELNNKNVDFAITSDDFYINACIGNDIFKNKHDNLRFISGLYYEVFLLITYSDSGIHEWKDLRGKIIGFPASDNRSFYNGFKLAQVVGLTPGKDFKYINVNSMNRLANLLLNKQVDAIYLTTSNKNPYLINLAKKMSLKFIGTSEMNTEILKKYFPYAVEKYINTNSFYTNNFKTNSNTSSFIKSFAVRIILIAHKNVSTDYVYNLTRTLFQNADQLKTFISNYLYSKDNYDIIQDAFIPIEMAYLNKLMNYHPGAEKYYYEFAYLTHNPNTACNRYIGQNIFTCPTLTT